MQYILYLKLLFGLVQVKVQGQGPGLYQSSTLKLVKKTNCHHHPDVPPPPPLLCKIFRGPPKWNLWGFFFIGLKGTYLGKVKKRQHTFLTIRWSAAQFYKRRPPPGTKRVNGCYWRIILRLKINLSCWGVQQ
jgi:hypothetical protein